MRKTLALLLGLATVLPAQMSIEQKLLDFQQLAAVYAKQYAPYEWKRDAIGFDLLEIGPWLTRVRNTKDDFEFLDLCTQYVASLRDGHSQLVLPSNFVADTGLLIDLYEGKVLIDAISRRALPESQFGFEVGDELLAVDGREVADWVGQLEQFTSSANKRSLQRLALDLLVFRQQATYPRAHQVPSRSRFLIRRKSGLVEAYDVPWQRFGTPLTAIGPVPSPRLFSKSNDVNDGEGESPARKPLRGLAQLRLARAPNLRAVRGLGAVAPVFDLPATFTRRLGGTRDLIFSGVLNASGLRIGFVRIGFMSDPSNPFVGNAQISQLLSEIRFFEANSDGLILDVMRNPGGDFCFAQDLMSLLVTKPFQVPGLEIRATREWILLYESLISQLEAGGTDRWIIDYIDAVLGDIRGAYSENRGRTGPLPVCDLGLEAEPARDSRGNLLGYTKPVMVLVDDFSASAAEIFAGMVQDNNRGIVFGMPSMGLGGSVSGPQAAGAYSEAHATVTQSIVVRPRTISSPEFPDAPYIENIGVRPDVPGDLMTIENLENGGRTFVQQFTEAMVQHIRSTR